MAPFLPESRGERRSAEVSVISAWLEDKKLSKQNKAGPVKD